VETKPESIMNEKDISNIVHEKFDDAVGFDPFTILMIVSICISAFRMLQQCKKGQDFLKRSAARKGLAYKLFIEKHLINELKTRGINPATAEELAEDLRQKYVNS
jgi:hypothetical protein